MLGIRDKSLLIPEFPSEVRSINSASRMCGKDKAEFCLPAPCAHRQTPGVSTKRDGTRDPETLKSYSPPHSRGKSSLTFPDFVVEIDGIHGSCDDVGLAVACSHNPGHFIHELHRDTCTEEGHMAGESWRKRGCSHPGNKSSHPYQQGLQSAGGRGGTP